MTLPKELQALTVPFTTEEFHAWMDLLIYACGSRAEAARILEYSPLTLSKWIKEKHPIQWYWRIVFPKAVDLVLDEIYRMEKRTKSPHQLQGLKSKKEAILRRRTEAASLAPPGTPPLPKYDMGTNVERARMFLLRFMKKPNHPYKFSVIERRANEDGIHTRDLRRAADLLVIEKKRDEFQGPSYWYRPMEEYERALSQSSDD